MLFSPITVTVRVTVSYSVGSVRSTSAVTVEVWASRGCVAARSASARIGNRINFLHDVFIATILSRRVWAGCPLS